MQERAYTRDSREGDIYAAQRARHHQHRWFPGRDIDGPQLVQQPNNEENNGENENRVQRVQHWTEQLVRESQS